MEFASNTITKPHTVSIYILIFFLLILPSTSSALEKVSVQLEWIYQFEFAGFIAAKEKGFYKDVGLDVELIEYQQGDEGINKVLDGRVNYGIHNSSLVIKNGELVPVVLLGTYLQHSPLIFVTNKTINTPTDLIGKTIMATSDEFNYSSLALMMNHFFINKKNTRFVEHSFNLEDFISGKVDAMSAFRTNQLYLLEQRKIDYNTLDPTQYGFFMGAVNLYTSINEAQKHGERTRRFVEATNKGWQYAIDHKDELIQLIYDKYSQIKSIDALRDEADRTEKMMYMDFYPIGAISEELSKRAFRNLQSTGIIDKNAQYNFLTLDDVVADSKSKVRLTPDEQKYLAKKVRLNLCVDPNWLPYEQLKDGVYSGAVADIFTKMIKPQLPVSLEVHQSLSWNESLQAIKTRDCDLISLASQTTNRQDYLDFTSPYFEMPIVLATSSNEAFIGDITKLDDKKIGVIKGSAISENLHHAYPKHDFTEVTSTHEGLRMVRNEDLFGFIDTLGVIAFEIQNNFTDQLKISAQLDQKISLGIATRNDEPLLHDIFEKIIRHINARPEKLKLLNGWVSVKNQTTFDYELFWKAFIVIGLLALAFTYHYVKLHQLNRKLRVISNTDPLTGLYNRLSTERELEKVQFLSNRYQQSCGLIMLDIDFFKQINDRFGHSTGDTVLVEFAKLLQKHSRSTDSICRWGGEEFLIICPGLDIDQTEEFANKLLQNIRQNSFPHNKKMTASIGVGVIKSNSDTMKTIDSVDKALYRAKQNNRDQVVRAEL